MIGRLRVYGDGTLETAFLPIWNARPRGSPEVARGNRAKEVSACIEAISLQASLPPLSCEWQGLE